MGDDLLARLDEMGRNGRGADLRRTARDAAAEVRALRTQLDAARAVIRRVCSGWIDDHEPMTPAEVEAIRTATEDIHHD